MCMYICTHTHIYIYIYIITHTIYISTCNLYTSEVNSRQPKSLNVSRRATAGPWSAWTDLHCKKKTEVLFVNLIIYIWLIHGLEVLFVDIFIYLWLIFVRGVHGPTCTEQKQNKHTRTVVLFVDLFIYLWLVYGPEMLFVDLLIYLWRTYGPCSAWTDLHCKKKNGGAICRPIYLFMACIWSVDAICRPIDLFMAYVWSVECMD